MEFIGSWFRHFTAAAHALQRQALGSTARRSIAANAAWLFFDRIVRAILGLLVGAWVARYLGPTQYGTLAYVTAFVAMFTAVANLSADAIVVRDIAQEPDAAAEILGSTLLTRSVLGILCWAVAVLSVAITNAGDSQTIAMAAIVGSMLVFQAADTVDLWFQSQSQSRRTVVAKLLSYLLSSGVRAGLIVSDAPLAAFAWVAAFDALVCAIALAASLRFLPTSRRWSFRWQRCVAIVKEAAPLIVSGMSIMVYIRIDQILIKELLDARSLGLYSAALPLSQFWQVIPLALTTSLAPFVARQKISDETQYRRSIVFIFRGFFYAGVCIAALVWLSADFLVLHLFGPNYAGSSQVLQIHAVSNVFLFLGVAHSLWLVNERRFGVRLWGTLAAALTTVALNLTLLPRLGMISAAYTAVVAQCIAAFLINVLLDPQGFRMQCNAILLRKT